MPEFVGRLRTPRLAAAPSSPITGEMYYDTATNKLYYWDGAAWVSGGGGEVFEQPLEPTGPTVSPGDIWIDTDAPTPSTSVNELGYAQITSQVAITATTDAAPTDVVTLPAITFDGGPCLFEFWSPYVEVPAPGGIIWISLYEGATQLGRLGIVNISGTAGNQYTPFYGALRFQPSVGAHTYKVGAHKTGPNPNVGGGGSGTAAYMPAFARVTRI